MNKQVEKNKSAQLTAITKADLGLAGFAEDTRKEYATWVRVLLQNWRQGTVGCKDRSEVNYTNKKPWKQKGTGRARAGSARSPIWRGGGVSWGPKPRVRTLKLNRKSKSRVLSALISEFAQNQKLFTLDWQLEGERPSTSAVYKTLKQVGFDNKKIILFLDRNDIQHWMSVRNIPNVYTLSFDDVNAYELSLGHHIVVLQKDLHSFKDMVNTWN